MITLSEPTTSSSGRTRPRHGRADPPHRHIDQQVAGFVTAQIEVVFLGIGAFLRQLDVLEHPLV